MTWIRGTASRLCMCTSVVETFVVYYSLLLSLLYSQLHTQVSVAAICVHDNASCIGLWTASDAIEAEAVLFGTPLTLTLTGVVGCCIAGAVNTFCSSTDVVLAITKVPYRLIILTVHLYFRCLTVRHLHDALKGQTANVAVVAAMPLHSWLMSKVPLMLLL